jgi:hypothetical protein
MCLNVFPNSTKKETESRSQYFNINIVPVSIPAEQFCRRKAQHVKPSQRPVAEKIGYMYFRTKTEGSN